MSAGVTEVPQNLSISKHFASSKLWRQCVLPP